MTFPISKRDGKWPPLSAWQYIETSTPMKRALRSLLRQEIKARVDASIFTALEARRLVTSDGELSETGTVYAMSLCPLHEQAARLEINFHEDSIKRTHRRPEFDVLQHYRDDGATGCFTEGGIVFVLLYAIWFDRLFEYVAREWPPDVQVIVESMNRVRYNVFSYIDFVHAFPSAKEALIQAIADIATTRVLDAYRHIERLQYNNTWFPYGYYGITENLVGSLLEILGRKRLQQIAMVYLDDPRLYTKGWPDLLVIKDGAARFIEVKTTDKLHISQIIVMPAMMRAASLNFEIVKIVRHT